MTKVVHDVLILGAGVVGLSTGIGLLESKPSLKVLVLDKERSLGAHASGRNSGVLHAGFYYSPDSLKARFCKEGNFELKKLCADYEIPVLNCGKVVVTQDDSEETRLDDLFVRGVINGVELEILDKSKLVNFEPLAKTHSRFLWSPTTSVSSPEHVIKSMADKFLRLGGKLKLGEKIHLDSNGSEVVSNFKFKRIVNCGGAQADRIARKLGEASEYAMLPFMGTYRLTSHSNLPMKTLVYPVPHPINPFLGVHFTLTLDGKVKIGPTAIPIAGREQYSIKSGWSLSDLGQATRGAFALAIRDSHDLSEIVKNEWPKLFKRNLVREGSKLVPNASKVFNWSYKPPGIRAQLVNLKTGRLEQDFVIRQHLNATHILNTVSPGWTSSIPFGRYVAERYILPEM